MSADGPRLVHVEDDDGIRTVTLDRPERRNALSTPLMRSLLAVLADAARNDEVRVVRLRGAGPDLCAGHDLAEMAALDVHGFRALFALATELMLAIHRQPQPVVAQVHGVASGAGLQLVAACDLAVAADDARFAAPAARLGLLASTPLVELSRALAPKHALELALTAEAADAETARRIGLVNAVVPRAALEQAGRELARRVAAAPRQVLAAGKAAFWRQLGLPLEEAYALVEAEQAAHAVAPPAQEALRAFLRRGDG